MSSSVRYGGGTVSSCATGRADDDDPDPGRVPAPTAAPPVDVKPHSEPAAPGTVGGTRRPPRRLDPPGRMPHPQAEVELLRPEWSSLSGVQRVQRVAMLELHTGVEWTTLGDIFTRRGAIVEWREEAA